MISIHNLYLRSPIAPWVIFTLYIQNDFNTYSILFTSYIQYSFNIYSIVYAMLNQYNFNTVSILYTVLIQHYFHVRNVHIRCCNFTVSILYTVFAVYIQYCLYCFPIHNQYWINTSMFTGRHMPTLINCGTP